MQCVCVLYICVCVCTSVGCTDNHKRPQCSVVTQSLTAYRSLLFTGMSGRGGKTWTTSWRQTVWIDQNMASYWITLLGKPFLTVQFVLLVIFQDLKPAFISPFSIKQTVRRRRYGWQSCSFASWYAQNVENVSMMKSQILVANVSVNKISDSRKRHVFFLFCSKKKRVCNIVIW